MDKSRRQFEATIKKLSDPSEFESKLKRANNGLNYADRDVDLMWISWQASRESLINNLEPVGYMRLEGCDNIKEYGFTHIYEYKFDKESIPLYSLDK
ncbi:hypothetical protein I4990_00660 [Providencia alcalifaciens]|uniref:hypothetical protein n=1 Tax=Providencia alcalifaciens TaxID=126385 RepID=UPI0018C47DFD|nr:hypothetical protein [Providencia alcalifaciens]MBG5881466.1 hypothetical protein [Providencia alcalifaciens]